MQQIERRLSRLGDLAIGDRDNMTWLDLLLLSPREDRQI